MFTKELNAQSWVHLYKLNILFLQEKGAPGGIYIEFKPPY